MSDKSADRLASARAAKPKARKVFSALLGDVAIGISRVDGEYGLKVNLESLPDPKIELPKEVEGVPVTIEVTGRISKRGTVPKPRTED
jgi:hypothetical protein